MHSINSTQVDHLDRQVQIFDLRKSNFDRKPVMEFGYRPAQSMREKHDGNIYRKGSTSYALFARGYSDGTLCIWDYRNTVVRMFPHVCHMSAVQRPSFRSPPERARKDSEQGGPHRSCGLDRRPGDCVWRVQGLFLEPGRFLEIPRSGSPVKLYGNAGI